MGRIKVNEKRDFFRMTIEKGEAFCSAPGAYGRFKIADLSRGGVGLCGDLNLKRSEVVRLELRVEQIGDAHVEGVVVREGPTTAVEFKKTGFIAKSFFDEIELRDTIDNNRSLILVVSQLESECCAIEKSLARHGLMTVRARTAGQAFNLLADPWMPFTSVVISSTFDGLELHEFFAREFPQVAQIQLQSVGRDCRRQEGAVGITISASDMHRTADAISDIEERVFAAPGQPRHFRRSMPALIRNLAQH